MFDPVLISWQIVTLQCCFYAIFMLLLGLSALCFGSPMSLDLLFSPSYLSSTSNYWFLVAWTYLFAGLAGSYLLSVVVERLKKCLDFTFTLYFIHVFLCTFYEGFPVEWGFWMSNGVSFLIMVFLGEYLCSRLEMENIPLYVPSSSRSSSSSSTNITTLPMIDIAGTPSKGLKSPSREMTVMPIK